jgi:predicted deacylase
VQSIPKQVGIGTSVQGRSIDAHTFGSPQTIERHVVFIGGIHGGYEWNTTELAYKALDYFAKNPHIIPTGTSVAIIPSLNPDGLAKSKGEAGRFNARGVDLNRNFACKWQSTGAWKGKKVNAGTEAFSEPEAAALRDYVTSLLKTHKPEQLFFVFWHSKASAVYASACGDKPLPATLELMRTYASAAGYKAVESFDAYPVTGAAEDWLASLGIAAITVELSTHVDVEWEKNKKGIDACLGASH